MPAYDVTHPATHHRGVFSFPGVTLTRGKTVRLHIAENVAERYRAFGLDVVEVKPEKPRKKKQPEAAEE